MVKTYQRNQAEEKLSENFRVREFQCKCGKCEPILIDDDLIDILQKIRDNFGVSVHVNSGYRCRNHNQKVGGDPNSSHMEGMAADIRVKGASPKEVARFAESIGVQRIGLYDTFCHIGSGKRKFFWINHNSNPVDTFGGAERTTTVTLPVLRRGMKNDAVRAMQTLLGVTADGSFGSKTDSAVRQFQKNNDLEVDGSCGPATWAKLLGV